MRNLHVTIIALAVMTTPAVLLAVNSSVPFIRADQVHAQGISGAGVTVAVLDTGIDRHHPGLNGSIAPGGTGFEGGVQQPDIGDNVYGEIHGTYMSVIITDSTGVAPGADILSVRVLGIGGQGFVNDIVLGIQYVILLHQHDPSIRVINMSFGGGAYSCPCDLESPDESSALAEALAANILPFVATGNETQCGGISAPACVTAAVKVAASYDAHYPTTDFGDCGDFSPPAYWITCFSNIAENCDLLLAAPGYQITVGGFSGDGTSQATAHCSGVAALMFEKNGCGGMDPYTARNIIFNTASIHEWASPHCPLPPEPRHVDALAAVNAVVRVACLPGDTNCDGVVDINDLPHFTQALIEPFVYDADHDGDPYAGCSRINADLNANGLVNGMDIQLFVNALIGP